MKPAIKKSHAAPECAADSSMLERLGTALKSSRMLAASLVVGTSLALGACATGYTASAPMGSSYGTVESGYIEDVQYYQSSGSTSGAGAIIGGVAGGVIGHQVGGGVGNTVATVAGAIGGALIGNEVERNNQRTGEYTVVRVRLDGGGRIELQQPADFRLRQGERVRVYDRQRIGRG